MTHRPICFPKFKSSHLFYKLLIEQVSFCPIMIQTFVCFLSNNFWHSVSRFEAGQFSSLWNPQSKIIFKNQTLIYKYSSRSNFDIRLQVQNQKTLNYRIFFRITIKKQTLDSRLFFQIQSMQTLNSRIFFQIQFWYQITI
jgi:hypothetical protein